MSRTIVQEYGPIYGEPVNGTVMGRPNGSVYVPSQNKVQIDFMSPDYSCLAYRDSETFEVVSSEGEYAYYGLNLVAQSQDLSSYLQLQIYSDAELTTLVGSRNLAQGNFNAQVSVCPALDDSLTDGQTVYIRVQLINSGYPVATSDTLESEMVVP